MRKLHLAYVFVAVLGVTLLLLSRPPMSAQQAGAIPIDNDDLGGTVTGPKGPEAGVWVIAETADLPTKFVKIVVTDDRGRYLIPDLESRYNCALRPALNRRAESVGHAADVVEDLAERVHIHRGHGLVAIASAEITTRSEAVGREVVRRAMRLVPSSKTRQRACKGSCALAAVRSVNIALTITGNPVGVMSVA